MTFDQWWKHIFGDKKIPDWIHETTVRLAYEAATKAEREACAKLVEADGLARGADGYMLIKAATRIRARGET
jgi:hypothetical protein